MNPQQPAAAPYSAGGGSGKTALIIILALLLVGSLAFGGWAFMGMQDYKNKSDQKSAAAVEAAKKIQAQQLNAQFAQQNKSPYKSFRGSSTYGSISFKYPKTWSAYIDTTNSSQPINGYFHPSEVPSTQSKTAYALRVELTNTDYAQVAQQFSSQITQGTVTAKAYVPPKLKGVRNVSPGTYYSGQISSQDTAQRGYLLAIKVRDKTLKVYTESGDFLNDFNNIVLASLSFAP